MAGFDISDGIYRAFLAGVGAVASGAEKGQQDQHPEAIARKDEHEWTEMDPLLLPLLSADIAYQCKHKKLDRCKQRPEP